MPTFHYHNRRYTLKPIIFQRIISIAILSISVYQLNPAFAFIAIFLLFTKHNYITATIPIRSQTTKTPTTINTNSNHSHNIA